MHVCECAFKVSKFHLRCFAQLYTLPFMFEPSCVSSAQYCVSPEAENVDNGEDTELSYFLAFSNSDLLDPCKVPGMMRCTGHVQGFFQGS